MAKKQITWLELVKQKMNVLKAKGQKPSIRDVTGDAKKEWASIKAGTHDLYEQGKSSFFGKKKSQKSQKTKKIKKGTKAEKPSPTDISVFLSHIKLCKNCKKTIKKALGKHLKGGMDDEEMMNDIKDNEEDEEEEEDEDAEDEDERENDAQFGGKKKRKN